MNCSKCNAELTGHSVMLRHGTGETTGRFFCVRHGIEALEKIQEREEKMIELANIRNSASSDIRTLDDGIKTVAEKVSQLQDEMKVAEDKLKQLQDEKSDTANELDQAEHEIEMLQKEEKED